MASDASVDPDEEVTAKRLARGTKLTPEHVFGPLERVAAKLSGNGIGSERMETGFAPFRVNLHIPWIASDFFRAAAKDDRFCVPFMLPPVQEWFGTITSNNRNYPNPPVGAPEIRLTELSFAIDQRDEPAAIADMNFGGTASDAGKLDFRSTALDAYTIEVALLEKTPVFFGGGVGLEREVLSFSLPSDAFSGADFRANPFPGTGLNKVIDPYKTYVLAIKAPNLKDWANDNNYALVSVTVSMRFACRLLERDAGSDIQNIPPDEGQRTAPIVTINAPTAGDTIEASGASGVDTAIATIDDVFLAGLEGGYDEGAHLPPTETLAHDACYTVLAIPMFQGRRYSGITSDSATASPVVDTYSADEIADRRLVMLGGPLSIHHVLLSWNWQCWSPIGIVDPVSVPSGSTFTVEAGLAMMSGIRSDDHAYEDIAYLSASGPRTHGTWEGAIVDKVKTSRQSPSRGGVSVNAWDLELHVMPLVGSGGAGFYAQGKPIFVAPGWSSTSDRANVNGAAPATGGAEQALEARIVITDSAEFTNPNEVVVGYQGVFMYVIGKGSLTR